MKTISTLFSSLLMSATMMAAPSGDIARAKSMLTVNSTDNAVISVVVDGRRFEPNDNSIIITGLDAGTHTVKIYRQRSGGVFNMRDRRYEMVYNTSVMVRPKTNVTVNIDRFGRTSISEEKLRGGRWNDDRRQGRDFDYDRDGKNGDFDRDGHYGDYDNNYGYERGMDDREFRQVLQSIEKEWLESNKLRSATHIVTSNMLTSAQVKQLVLMFSFEDNKLNLAKQAYRNTVDKRNYYIINDAFSFNSSKEDLNRFIRTTR